MRVCSSPSNGREADRREVLAMLKAGGAGRQALVPWQPSRLAGRPLLPHERQRLRRALLDLAARGVVEAVHLDGRRRLSHVRLLKPGRGA